MGKYIYEGHLGGLYCSDEKIDYSNLYCDQCGDSDRELGYVNNLNEAWALLKSMTDTFDCSMCENCPHEEDFDYCNNSCEGYQNSGGFSLSYVMKFLADNFKCDKLHCVYLISRHIQDSDWIFVDCDPLKKGFGHAQALPVSVCPFEEYVSMIASSMRIFLDGPSKDLKEVTSESVGNKVIHIFSCVEELDEEYPNTDWKESASYKNDSWYGYMSKSDINLIDGQKCFERYL